MAISFTRCKTLLLIVFAFVLNCGHIYAAWELSIFFRNNGSGGNYISEYCTLGENSNATNGWDFGYDQLYSPPPISGSYVQVYFPHTDWGTNNGNYRKDIRAANPALKTWSMGFIASSPIGNSYTISWTIPPLMPDYYQPKLLIGSQTINMRSQSSHTYNTFYGSGSVRLDYVPGMPYLLALPPNFEFNDNQAQYLNLRRYFAVLSGNLSFSYGTNNNLTQSLVTINDSLHWKVNPVHGFFGTTTVALNATGSSGTKMVNIQIFRDNSNSPPQYSNPPPELSVTQNMSVVLSWQNKTFDPDLDDYTVQIEPHSNFTAVVQNQQAQINPNPAYKGIDTLYVVLADGISPPNRIPIRIIVNPSTPQRPQNLNLTVLSSGVTCVNREIDAPIVCLGWDEVVCDTSGLPVSGLAYRVELYADAQCTVLLDSFVVQMPNVCLPSSYGRVFYKVIAINE